MTHSLLSARYLLLSTQKRDGSFVDTPVWFSTDIITPNPSKLFIFSASNVGKVKRIKNFAAVFVHPCNVTGKILGQRYDANAEIVKDSKQIHIAYTSLHKKYSWQMWLLDFFSKLSGKYYQREMIMLTLSPPEASINSQD